MIHRSSARSENTNAVNPNGEPSELVFHVRMLSRVYRSQLLKTLLERKEACSGTLGDCRVLLCLHLWFFKAKYTFVYRMKVA